MTPRDKASLALIAVAGTAMTAALALAATAPGQNRIAWHSPRTHAIEAAVAVLAAAFAAGWFITRRRRCGGCRCRYSRDHGACPYCMTPNPWARAR